MHMFLNTERNGSLLTPANTTSESQVIPAAFIEHDIVSLLIIRTLYIGL